MHSRLKHLPDAAGVLLVTAGPQQFGSDFLGRPVVVVDYGSEGSPFPHVTVDNLRAGFAATQCLIEAGHTAIGIITGPLGMQSAQDRLRGFRLALDEAGINFPTGFGNLILRKQGYAAARRCWNKAGGTDSTVLLQRSHGYRGLACTSGAGMTVSGYSHCGL